MEAFRIENLKFSYPNRNIPALSGISLSVEKGDFVVLCGASGCGKTTLLRHLKPELVPIGNRSGTLCFSGAGVDKIGFVMQSPENQIVTDKVWHELAFGLESLGKPTAEIRLRVAEMASFFGISTWFHKNVTELSGGQKQLLALASIMVMQPSVLILDEPTSRLDPIAAGEFLNIVGKINRDLGVTIIMTEHRLEEVFTFCSRVIVMESGRIIADGLPQEAGQRLGAAMPTPMKVWAASFDQNDKAPLTVKDGAKWLSGQKITVPEATEEALPTLKAAVTLTDTWFRYEKNQPDILKGLNFTACYGEIVCILGGNGTGKTTMLSLIAGINKAYRGKVFSGEAAYMLPQDPQALFIAKTVREDLYEISRDEVRVGEVVKLCRLDGLLDAHPYDLSGGEQQRAALAKVLLLQPRILLLDEPTKGIDAEYKKTLAGILQNLKRDGVAVIIVSHDIEFCAECADRCALFFDGDIVTENTPRKFFSGNSFYTTAANRMARSVLPAAITAEDIITAIGGELPPSEPSILPAPQPPSPNVDCGGGGSRAIPFRTILAAVLIVLTIPLTISFGIHFFDDRQFYLISMLIIFQSMLPFFLLYEGRKPQARELVIIAVLCAVAVAGRAAFFMFPQFKPVLAVVIVAGVGLGGEVGFLVGAIVGFVSNMYFGQGPWTPWQMFAFGLIGFLAGVVFKKGLLRRSPIFLSIYGGFSAIFLYGGIMNPASVLIFQPAPTVEMFLLSYLYGLPFDIVHAVATVTFLLLISRPMLEKLERVNMRR